MINHMFSYCISVYIIFLYIYVYINASIQTCIRLYKHYIYVKLHYVISVFFVSFSVSLCAYIFVC